MSYEDVVAVDTDVLAIHHFFTFDKRFKTNKTFLGNVVKRSTLGITIHNLLELYGLATIAWGSEKAYELYRGYLRARNVAILIPPYPTDWTHFTEKICKYLAKKMHYGDALIAWAVDETRPSMFVTWNKKHFQNRMEVRVLTPEEFLKEHHSRR